MKRVQSSWLRRGYLQACCKSLKAVGLHRHRPAGKEDGFAERLPDLQSLTVQLRRSRARELQKAPEVSNKGFRSITEGQLQIP